MREEQLIKEIRINPDKFEKIYNQHYQTIFNYCYRRTGDFDTSKDITSEIFLKAYLNIHKFKWKDIP
ncbi:MAG: sigma factor, partial [Bacteroidetes bacterium]|nr:sigma factor [Bacteroidota bacterium]